MDDSDCTDQTTDGGDCDDVEDEKFGPHRLRKGEAVLQARTSRILLVLEQCHDSLNHQAVLRTAEAFGIQHIWTLEPTFVKNTTVCRKIDKGCARWLSLRTFSHMDELIRALRDDGREIWAADLGKDAEAINSTGPSLPKRVAIVIGRETDGVSPAMLQNCDKKIYLPMVGFTESFNLSVATALILQRLFDICPSARGEMDDAERRQLRLQWFDDLTRTNQAKYQADPRWRSRWLREDGSTDVVPLDTFRRDKETLKMTPKMRRKLKEFEQEAERVRAAAAAALPQSASGDGRAPSTGLIESGHCGANAGGQNCGRG